MINPILDGLYENYPNVVMEILEYFDINNNTPVSMEKKSVRNFCVQHINGETKEYSLSVIAAICKRLYDCGIMLCLYNDANLGINNNYMFKPTDREGFQRCRKQLSCYYNTMVFGLPYIYELYKNLVLPVVSIKDNGDYEAGTCFEFINGIVTAKHCLTDVNNLSIKNYTASELEGKPVYISDDDGVDIAFIEIGKQSKLSLYAEGQIMQRVIVMGYPKIPTFTSFLTAEVATISSKATARLTPTVGSIAANGRQYLTKTDAMLITAKIRGGNSGGPIINEYGCVVGVACQILDNNKEHGDYDDLGYGVALPISYVIDIITRKPKRLTIPEGFYRDFE